MGQITYRHPTVEDGKELYLLVKESESLELNTCYAYLLFATHFADTTIVAEHEGQLVGFVGAYRPPPRPEAVFVWQIGVRSSMRGRGVAKRILHRLVDDPRCEGVRYMESTVTPSNTASDRLFRGFARERNAPCEVRPFFATAHFDGDHEREDQYWIGPFERR